MPITFKIYDINGLSGLLQPITQSSTPPPPPSSSSHENLFQLPIHSTPRDLSFCKVTQLSLQEADQLIHKIDELMDQTLGEKGEIVSEHEVYEGYILNGNAHGFGTVRHENGDIYRGYFIHGVKNGFGVLNRANGSKYIGDWERGNYHGLGILTTNCPPYVQQEEGEFIEGKFHKGTLTISLKTVDKEGGSHLQAILTQQGHFDHNSALTGWGTQLHSDGNIEKAEFQNSWPKGIYEMVLASGKTIKLFTRNGIRYFHINYIFLPSEETFEEIFLIEFQNKIPQAPFQFYLKNKNWVHKLTNETLENLVELFFCQQYLAKKEMSRLTNLVLDIKNKIQEQVILKLSLNPCDPCHNLTELSRSVRPLVSKLITDLHNFKNSLSGISKKGLFSKKDCLDEEVKVIQEIYELSVLLGCRVDEVRPRIEAEHYKEHEQEYLKIIQDRRLNPATSKRSLLIHYGEYLQKLRNEKMLKDATSTPSDSQKTQSFPSRSKKRAKRKKKPPSAPIRKREIRDSRKPVASTSSSRDNHEMSPALAEARKLLADRLFMTPVILSLHPRVSRWRFGDIRNFVDRHPETKQQIYRYQQLSDSALIEQRARHFLPGLERLLSSDLFKTCYTFPTATGFGMLTQLKIDHEHIPGLVKIGINQSRIHHCFFEPFEINKDILQSAFLESHLEALETEADFPKEEGFLLTRSYSFEMNETFQLKVNFTNESHSLIILPLNVDLIEMNLKEISN